MSNPDQPKHELADDAGRTFGPTYVDGVPAIYSALDWLNRETRALAKTERNLDQKYNFRGIDSLYNAMHPLLAAASVVTVPGKILEVRSEQRMSRNGAPMNWILVRREYELLSLVDGSKHITEGIGEAVDVGDKGMNKAQTNAHKYLFFQLFTIPTDEPESDHFQPEAAGTYRNAEFQSWTPEDPNTWGPAAFSGRGPLPDERPAQERPRQANRPPSRNGQRKPAPDGPVLDLEALPGDLMNATTTAQTDALRKAVALAVNNKAIPAKDGARAMKMIKERASELAGQESPQ